MQKMTISNLYKLKLQAEKIVCLTCYDASWAKILSAAGIEVLLVGDSLGTVVQGHAHTIPVTIDQVIYHTECVARAQPKSLLISDLPFMSYRNLDFAFDAAARLMQAGAEMVKLEGGELEIIEIISKLTKLGIPVCGHLGLTPQSVHQFGGYKIQGRDEEQAKSILQAALKIQAAGAQLLVLECVPRDLAAQITKELKIPVIGIGCGVDVDGQILVLYDILGLGGNYKFAQNFLDGQNAGAFGAVKNYRDAVKKKSFPSLAQSFS